MNYTRFDVDVFVSYGHIDNNEESGRWIDRFHRQLEARVEQWLGRDVSIWRDNIIKRNGDFQRDIEKRLKQAAVLVPIVTPRFVQSEWCRHELEEFLGNHDASARGRVLKVIKTPVDLDDQPAPLRGMLGYEFYRMDANNRARELPDLDPEPDAEKRYLARIDDLAFAIHSILKGLREQKPAAAPTQFVYVADATSDLQELRAQIVRELVSQGYGVLPAAPLPNQLEAMKAAVAADLESCCLVISLTGSRYGLVPEGDEPHCQSWIQLQAAAEVQSRKRLPCLLWIAPGVDAAKVDPRQKSFLDWMGSMVEAQRQSELLRVPFESLKSHLFDRLRAPAPKPQAVAPPQLDKRIYLICDSRDFDAIEPVRSYLDARFEVILPAREGTQSEIREYHECALQDCDGVLIYYGTGSEAWLGTKISDLRRAMGLGRQTPFAAQGILIGPEPSEIKARYQNPRFEVMRPSDSLEDQLRPFVNRLSQAQGAAA